MNGELDDLRARIEALEQQTAASSIDQLTPNPFTIDPTTGQLKRIGTFTLSVSPTGTRTTGQGEVLFPTVYQTASQNQLLLLAAGSGFATVDNAPIGIELLLDGIGWNTILPMYQNQAANGHHALVPQPSIFPLASVPIGTEVGPFRLFVDFANNAVSPDDVFTLQLIEFL